MSPRKHAPLELVFGLLSPDDDQPLERAPQDAGRGSPRVSGSKSSAGAGGGRNAPAGAHGDCRERNLNCQQHRRQSAVALPAMHFAVIRQSPAFQAEDADLAPLSLIPMLLLICSTNETVSFMYATIEQPDTATATPAGVVWQLHFRPAAQYSNAPGSSTPASGNWLENPDSVLLCGECGGGQARNWRD